MGLQQFCCQNILSQPSARKRLQDKPESGYYQQFPHSCFHAMTASPVPTTAISHPPFPVLQPLLQRHLEDAAFYWAQLDASLRVTEYGLAKYQHFNQLLDIHLEGVAVAGAQAIEPACKLLGRWRGAGEAFVATWLALQRADSALLLRVLEQVAAQPERMLRGMISALAWQPKELALDWIVRLSGPTATPLMQVLALRAASLHKPYLGNYLKLSQPLDVYLDADQPELRAAACRALAAGLESQLPVSLLLQQAAQDAALPVRAEAALARARQGEGGPAIAALWQAVQQQSQLVQQASGWPRKQALRRLTRWLQHLGLLLVPGQVDLLQLARSLPPRQALHFFLAHGDPACLPLVAQLAVDPQAGLFAAWVWQSISGCDLQEHALTLPYDAAREWEGEAGQDAAAGMLAVDVKALQAHAANRMAGGQRVWLGQVLTPQLAYALLDDGPQALRALAALALQYVWQGQGWKLRFEVRAPAARQLQQLQQFAALLNQSGSH